MKRTILFSLASLAFTANVTSQETERGQSPIEEEFTRIIENSNDYQGYKVVDFNELVNLKNSTSQYFTKLNDEIITQQNTIDQQQGQISDLQDELETTQNNLEQVNSEKDSITFLGMPFSKGSYMTLMWGVVGVLILALLFFIYRFNKEHAQTKEAREKLDSTDKEFEVYRAKALEKEQRLGRLLQDERNKASDK